MPRLFTGLEIPEPLALRLSMIRAGLSGARWIEPENYHITLRFAGDIEERQAQDFAAALAGIEVSPFSLCIDGLGSFGNRRPRSIWAGLSSSDALRDLHAAHERAARYVGLEAEARKFTPHVTLARLKGTRAEAVTAFLEELGGFVSEPFEVSRFVLLSARESRGGGPYVVEAVYPPNII